MRWYKITITHPDTGEGVPLASFPHSQWPDGVITSALSKAQPNRTNAAALNIELDLPQYTGNAASGAINNYVRIWGLSLKDIASAQTNLEGKNCKVEVGMAPGLPLAKPSQQGVIVEGSIFLAFGNWLGTDMTLDLILAGSKQTGGTSPLQSAPTSVRNFVFEWKKGQKLADAIRETLKIAMPGYDADIQISDQRIGTAEPAEVDVKEDFWQFATFIKQRTTAQLNQTDDTGVDMVLGPKVIVREANPKQQPSAPSPIQIAFEDLLGQVTWIGPGRITAKLVMRGDLKVFDHLQFPKELVTTLQAGAFPGRSGEQRPSNQLGLGQIVQVYQIQHWGNFRQPDAMSWNTTIWGVTLGQLQKESQLQAGGGPATPYTGGAPSVNIGPRGGGGGP